MSSNINFGLRIKELISVNNITKTKAAQLLGYTLPGLDKILDKEDISTAILKSACEVFGVEMSYFLGNDSSIKQKGNANIAGSGNVQYKGENNSINTDNRIELLLNENQHLKEQNQLLKQMVELLKPKTET